VSPRVGRRALVALCSCIFLAGCGSSESSSNLSGKSIEVTEASWHNGTWPLTVDRGILGCTKPPYPGEVTFNVEGKPYGLNGTALDQGLPEINPIWRHEGPELRVDIGPMIERSLKLCEEGSSE
jgi:hypothetical protein